MVLLVPRVLLRALELEDENRNLLLLLDEPGLNLHAMAQKDFLRFIDERLAPRHQVIYTTHSPFMIDLDRLGSVRTVQDMDDRGTVVSDDVMVHDSETVFPLQVAMGYQLGAVAVPRAALSLGQLAVRPDLPPGPR